MHDQNTNAVLLLCSHFSNPKSDASKPLTPLEYGRLARWLHEQGHKPQDLLLDFDSLVEGWTDPKGKITRERLKKLFDRSVALALALEKWQRAGIWVMTRSDPEYPRRLKKRLEYSSPALFYGVGDKRLLNAGGVAIVGSRGIDDREKQYTHDIAREAALEGLNVVSGGAKGVDETAMLGALSVEGTAIGVLAEGLLKAAVSSKWREYILEKQLVIVSPFYPEARFQVGNAMARNKYIYCLADYGLVVRSDEGSGGTWSGAIENLKKGWVPLFVKSDSDATGNAALISQGAFALLVGKKYDGKSGSEPLRAALGMYKDEPDVGLPEESAAKEPVAEYKEDVDKSDVQGQKAEIVASVESVKEGMRNESAAQPDKAIIDAGQDTFYSVFVVLLKKQFNETTEVKMQDFNKSYPDLMPKQVTTWFDRAENEGLIERKGKRRIYTLKGDSQEMKTGNLELHF